MSVEGYVLDVKPARDRVLLRIIDSRGYMHKLYYRLKYYGYLLPRVDPLVILRDLLGVEDIIDAWVEEWFLPPYYEKTTRIVVFTTYSLEALSEINHVSIAKSVAEPVNTYPDPLVEALWRSKLPVSTPIRISGYHIEALDDPSNPFYAEPPYRHVYVRMYKGNTRIYTHVMGFDKVVVENSNLVVEGGIDKIVDYLYVMKPHIVYMSLPEKILLQQHYPELFDELKPIWIDDTQTLINHQGLVYWSRLSYTPMRMLNYATIGKILTTLEAFRARKRKYLVVKGHGRREPWRSLRSLIEYDRGGAVFTPKPGLYWNICQIDYNSLYPTIISKYNISGETIDNPYCNNNYRPEGSPHLICIDKKGLVSEVLGELVELRNHIKEAGQTTDNPEYEAREKALKWILVSGFGYLGYRNSLFGSIMAHETVTGIARNTLLKIKRILEKHGYRVIHGIIDSIFVESCNCEEVLRIVNEHSLPAKIEAEYTWLYIPPVKTTSLGTTNKYYGRLRNGGLKIKGVMAVRNNTPPYIRETQLKALEILSKAKIPEEFREKLIEAHRVFEKAVNELMNKKVKPWKLTITVNARTESTRNTPWRKAMMKIPVITGNNQIVYIMRKNREPEPYTDNIKDYDIEYYIELLMRAKQELPSMLVEK